MLLALIFLMALGFVSGAIFQMLAIRTNSSASKYFNIGFWYSTASFFAALVIPVICSYISFFNKFSVYFWIVLGITQYFVQLVVAYYKLRRRLNQNADNEKEDQLLDR